MTYLAHLRLALGWLRRRLYERVEAARLLRRVAPSPLPPRRLRARVGAAGEREFRDGGADAAVALLGVLDADVRTRVGSVLDWGCGAGRVLPHVVAGLGEVEAVGVDVDPTAIAWARAHLAPIRFHTSAAQPPLPLGEARFDLIYAISVFSHLDAVTQDAWLAELAVRLTPGGRLLLSVHGPSAFAAFRDGRVSTTWCASGAFDRPPLADTELVHVPYRVSRFTAGDLPGVSADYGLSFHGPQYIRSHWGRWLEIEAIHPAAVSGWQDLVLARSR